MMRGLEHTAFRAIVPLLGTFLLLGACGDTATDKSAQTQPAGSMSQIASVTEALQSPPTSSVDLGLLQEAEIEEALGAGPYCAFTYTMQSPSVLAITASDGESAQGVIKLHGKLVLLEMQEAFEPARLSEPAVLLADGARIELTMALADEGGATEAESERAADVVFSLDEGLRVGYRGWYDCRSTGQ